MTTMTCEQIEARLPDYMEGDLTGDDSMRRDGMHQEQEGMASERAESAEEQAQAERERAAEHHAERSDS